MHLTSQQKRNLKTQAHNLKPLVHVGKQGITESLIEAIIVTLDSHELIKIKYIEFKDDRKTLSNQIEEKSGAALVGIVGNVATFYRQSTIEAKRKIKI